MRSKFLTLKGSQFQSIFNRLQCVWSNLTFNVHYSVSALQSSFIKLVFIWKGAQSPHGFRQGCLIILIDTIFYKYFAKFPFDIDIFKNVLINIDINIVKNGHIDLNLSLSISISISLFSKKIYQYHYLTNILIGFVFITSYSLWGLHG